MKDITVKKNNKFVTKNRFNEENGWLVPIVNSLDDFPKQENFPKQVYLTVANGDEIKGPHLHKKRWQLYTCIKGNIKVVVRIDGIYKEYYSGEDYEFSTIQIPAGIPSACINLGSEEAYILNMPSPAWDKNDIDDWEVHFDDYDFSKK